jgi:TRAP-type C4-dicarboxylate transport system permease small subunit
VSQDGDGSESKPDSKADSGKAAAKSDDKAASKADDKAASSKSDDKAASKADDKATSSKSDDKPAAKSDDKASSKSDDKPAAKSDDKAAASKSDDKASSKSDKGTSKSDDKASSKSDKPAAKSDTSSSKSDKATSKSDDKASSNDKGAAKTDKAAAKTDKSSSKSDKAAASEDPAADAGEPPQRPSQSLLDINAPLTFPDDSALSGFIRKLDNYIGIGEQAILFAILAMVVLTASANAIIEKATEQGLWWSYDVIRGGTFAVAMMGAAFATHQSRHLAMDLISRSLPRRARLVLQCILELFTIVICCVLARSGLHQLDFAGDETGRHLLEAKQIAMFLPVGAGLIILHSFLHLLIDIDYLARGKLLPERARSGH